MQNNIVVANLGSGAATLELTAANAQWGVASIQLNRPTTFQTNFAVAGGAYLGKYDGSSVVSCNVGTLTVQALSTGSAYVAGNNTFVGTVVLPQGNITTFHANAFGGSGNAVEMSGSAGLALYASNLTIGSLTGASGNSINTSPNGSCTLTVTSATNTTFAGVISGTGGIVKADTGTLALSGANNYSGTTFVNSGRLAVNNVSGSGTGSGAVTVSAGGALGGTGSISGAVTVNSGGHAAPSNSVESLDVGSLVLNTGSILDFELGAPGAPGINSDLINVTSTGGLTLNGGSFLLTNVGGLTAGTYRLIDYAGTLSGALANLGTPTGPAGFVYTLFNNTSNTSIDLTVTAGLLDDYNRNGIVDAPDYVLWRKTVGSTTNLVADGNANGQVDSGEYDVWRSNFGHTLSVAGPTGDYNGNGIVDTANYVVWRKSDGTQAGYDAWRTHFGQPADSGTGAIAGAAVPEPSTLVLLMFAAIGWCFRRGRAA
jgi:fibronectin-binding autotransporter adhesin